MVSLTPLCTTFFGGTTAEASKGATKQFIVDGTWAENDRFQLVVVTGDQTYYLSETDVLKVAVVHGTVHRGQVMLCAGDKLFCSGIGDATAWTVRTAGYGFITMSEHSDSTLATKAVAVYAGKVVLFAEDSVQLWRWNADPVQWELLQILQNTGTIAPNSVVSVGELDVFYLSRTGVRSIRAREFTDLVNVQDVGTRLDTEIASAIGTYYASYTSASGYYSQSDGRYWLFTLGGAYCFSYFPSEKVSAWSKYSLTIYEDGTWYSFFPFYKAAKEGVLYLLAAEPWTGDNCTTRLAKFPGSQRRGTFSITIPFFDEKTPATKKFFKGIDIIGKGTWKIEAGNYTASETTFVTIASAANLSTLEKGRVPLNLRATHLILRLTHTANEEAVIASVAYHYTVESAD